MNYFGFLALALLCVTGCQTFNGASSNGELPAKLKNPACLNTAVAQTPEIKLLTQETKDEIAKTVWNEKIFERTYMYRFTIPSVNDTDQGHMSVHEQVSKDPKYNKIGYGNIYGRARRAAYSPDQLSVISATIQKLNDSVKNACALKDFSPDIKSY